MDADAGKGEAEDFDPDDQCRHRHRRLTLAPREPFSCNEVYMENINGVQAKLQPVTESTSDHSEASEYGTHSGGGRASKDDSEERIKTATEKEIIDVARYMGFSVDEILQAEHELQAADQVSLTTPLSLILAARDVRRSVARTDGKWRRQGSGARGGTRGERRPWSNPQYAARPKRWHGSLYPSTNGRGRMYGGQARGWPRYQPRGYSYTGTRFNGTLGVHGGGSRPGHIAAQPMQTSGEAVPDQVQLQRQLPVEAAMHLRTPRLQMQRGPQGSCRKTSLKSLRFSKNRAGKAKVEEGSSRDKEKSFGFRCYKPGHGKLECIAKLLCEICGSIDHLTSKCPILKQPRLLAHPCGYDVSGLGFYHIPHAPIGSARSDNRTALVTLKGGNLSIPQSVAELGRLIPERWLWNITQQDSNSFVVSFPSLGDLQRSVALGKADIKEHGVSLHFEEWSPDEEGQELPRVWIRIFRLSKKLR
jgi:hypothetical protein